MKDKAILFVDDEAIILLSMKSQVKNHFGEDYIYVTAETGEEAMELIHDLHAEGVVILVIVSDWAMPGMNGDEFLRLVHQKFPKIELIVVTGYADLKSVEALQTEIGLSSFLKKPWEERELISAISKALQN